MSATASRLTVYFLLKKNNTYSNSEFARFPLSPQTPFFLLKNAICNSKRSHWIGMPWFTNGGRT